MLDCDADAVAVAVVDTTTAGLLLLQPFRST